MLTNELASGILPDLPLVMHGSGDVHPRYVSDATASLLSHLVAIYIRDLIDAALDAHDILTDGSGAVLPPPNYLQSSQYNSNQINDISNKRRKTLSKNSVPNGFSDWEFPNGISNIYENSEDYYVWKKRQSLPVDKYCVGVSGVDLHQNYIRSTYSTAPYTIGTLSFIFPICHDSFAYTRVKEIQSARNIFTNILIDPVILNCLNEENRKASFSHLMSTESDKLRIKSNAIKSTSGSNSENVLIEGEVEGHNVIWPGMEMLLPVYGTENL